MEVHRIIQLHSAILPENEPSNNAMALKFPWMIEQCRGVWPSKFCLVFRAPATMSASMVEAWPPMAARCKGVWPRWSPESSKCLITDGSSLYIFSLKYNTIALKHEVWPSNADLCKGVCPFWHGLEISAPCNSNNRTKSEKKKEKPTLCW